MTGFSLIQSGPIDECRHAGVIFGSKKGSPGPDDDPAEEPSPRPVGTPVQSLDGGFVHSYKLLGRPLLEFLDRYRGMFDRFIDALTIEES